MLAGARMKSSPDYLVLPHHCHLLHGWVEAHGVEASLAGDVLRPLEGPASGTRADVRVEHHALVHAAAQQHQMAAGNCQGISNKKQPQN